MDVQAHIGDRGDVREASETGMPDTKPLPRHAQTPTGRDRPHRLPHQQPARTDQTRVTQAREETLHRARTTTEQDLQLVRARPVLLTHPAEHEHVTSAQHWLPGGATDGP